MRISKKAFNASLIVLALACVGLGVYLNEKIPKEGITVTYNDEGNTYVYGDSSTTVLTARDGLTDTRPEINVGVDIVPYTTIEGKQVTYYNFSHTCNQSIAMALSPITYLEGTCSNCGELFIYYED